MDLNENSINIENNETDSEADNRIEKHLRKTLAPFQLINFLTFNSRYHIINNQITTKNNISIFLTILGTVILVCEKSYELYVLSYQNQLCWYKSVANFALYFDIFFYMIGYVFNAAILISSRDQNANFIIKLNKIYKALGVGKKFKFHTSFGIIVYLLSYFLGRYRTNVYNDKYFTKYKEVLMIYWSLFLMTTFDLNIIFAICIMKLFKILMETWTGKIKKCEEVDAVRVDKLFEHYVSVMDAYKTYNNLLQIMILFYNLDLIIHQMLCMGIFVELFAYNALPVEVFVPIFTLLIFAKSVNSCVLEVFLVYQCERFYTAHDKAMKECEVVLKQTDSDHVKKVCKNVRRVGRNEFNKLTICKLYEMDVQFLQSVAMLIANYLLVIMQFENLKFTTWERFNATIHSHNFTIIENNLT